MSYEYKGKIAEIGTPKQISDNFSIQTLVLSQEATKKDGEQFTKNALFEFSNLVEMGVIDPAIVPITALQKAVSVAGSILTTDHILTNI